MGAWIETLQTYVGFHILASLPVWERGLKHALVFAGGLVVVSLPVWERGLKPLVPSTSADAPVSLPVWERGLKQTDGRGEYLGSCRSPCGSVD